MDCNMLRGRGGYRIKGKKRWKIRMKKRANGVSMRLTEQWICIHTQYTCLHLKGCYGVHPACMAEPFQAKLDMLYIYRAHVCTGACRRGECPLPQKHAMEWQRIPGQSRKISRNRRCFIISSVEEMCKKSLFPTDLPACTNKQVRA